MNNYTEEMLAHVAKRENNTKRSYLVVDPLQGKHIPVSGKKALEMFDALAEKVRAAYLGDRNESLLLVGFAETATAIGARLAVTLESYYMQTTREILENADYLFFTESHSHATEQKLCKNDVEKIIGSVSRIVFVEDEVTTGNTIMKIIDIIERMYPSSVKFAVASLLNGMDDDSLARYREKNIDVHYLVKTHHERYSDIADKYSENGYYGEKDVTPVHCEYTNIQNNYINTRRLCSGSDYGKACAELAKAVISTTPLDGVKTAAVIGTEEFMYPAVYAASVLEEKGVSAFTHSTTRSPIAVSLDEKYPLQKRYELASFYDEQRKTFIYNIQKYDCVIVLTDSLEISSEGLSSLVNVLRREGNDNIHIFRWCSNGI